MHEQNRRHPTTGLEVPLETVNVTMYNILSLWSSRGVVFCQMFRSHLMKLHGFSTVFLILDPRIAWDMVHPSAARGRTKFFSSLKLWILREIRARDELSGRGWRPVGLNWLNWVWAFNGGTPNHPKLHHFSIFQYVLVYFSIESHGFDGSAPLKPPVGCHGESWWRFFLGAARALQGFPSVVWTSIWAVVWSSRAAMGCDWVGHRFWRG